MDSRSGSGWPTWKHSARATRSTPVPDRSIASRAAPTRSTARDRSYRGAAGSPAASSIESPATPVATHRMTLSATSEGSRSYPDEKSALTGTSTAVAISPMCARLRSRETTRSKSGSPWENAKPALVVARALKPRCCRYRAEPTSQGLGMTKQPRSCNARNARRRAASAALRVSSTVSMSGWTIGRLPCGHLCAWSTPVVAAASGCAGIRSSSQF